jgi:hypothetical protein
MRRAERSRRGRAARPGAHAGPVEDEARAPPDAWLPRVSRRSVITFAALVLLLLAPWPAVGRGFGALFSGYANLVVAVLGVGGARAPHFTAREPASAAPVSGEDAGTGDWSVWLTAQAEPGAGHEQPPAPLDTRIIGYTPLALFLALTLASPVPRRRKLRILAIGLALLLARLAIAIALPTARAFGRSRLASGPFAETIWFVLIDLPAASYVAPLVAWWLALGLTSRRP